MKQILHQFKPPTIRVVLRGRKSLDGKKLLYIRYAFANKVAFLSLKVSLLESDWDKKSEKVRNKNLHSPGLNALIGRTKAKFSETALVLMVDGVPPEFKRVLQRMKNSDGQQTGMGVKIKQMFDVVESLFERNLISASTKSTYTSVIRALIAHFPDAENMESLNKRDLEAFRVGMTRKTNENTATQYLWMLKAVFHHTVMEYELEIKDPFEFITFKKVKRISKKKEISESDYQVFLAAFQSGDFNLREKETLRKFLILCKGLRHSDAMRLKKGNAQTTHLSTGEKVIYFAIPAQKSEVPGIVFFREAEQDLLVFQNDGFLLPREDITTFNGKLREISQKILGRPITSHYGRHFAGQQIIENTSLTYSDVKAVLGLNSQAAAETYAARQVKSTIERIIMHEKDR